MTKVSLPFRPNLLSVKDADLMKFSAAVLAGDEGFLLQKVILLLNKIALLNLARKIERKSKM